MFFGSISWNGYCWGPKWAEPSAVESRVAVIILHITNELRKVKEEGTIDNTHDPWTEKKCKLRQWKEKNNIWWQARWYLAASDSHACWIGQTPISREPQLGKGYEVMYIHCSALPVRLNPRDCGGLCHRDHGSRLLVVCLGGRVQRTSGVVGSACSLLGWVGQGETLNCSLRVVGLAGTNNVETKWMRWAGSLAADCL